MIAIIDYGAGNTASVFNSFKDFGIEPVITKDLFVLEKADKIVLPGVGEASSAMNKINQLQLADFIKNTQKPFLGICLGMQLLFDFSVENNTHCLGIISGTVLKFDSSRHKVPHMGWNCVQLESNPLFKNHGEQEYFYFANSYFVPENNYTTASVEYGAKFSAAVNKQNFYGVQFHPEKSGAKGLQIIKNFIEL